jgi:hypothetical protein
MVFVFLTIEMRPWSQDAAIMTFVDFKSQEVAMRELICNHDNPSRPFPFLSLLEGVGPSYLRRCRCRCRLKNFRFTSGFVGDGNRESGIGNVLLCCL